MGFYIKPINPLAEIYELRIILSIEVLVGLSHSVLKSSTFMVFGSFFQKSAGLISTLVLARLLMPEDFGKVAFLALTVNFFNVMSITGTQQYILSKADVSSDDLNTAFSLDLLMKGAFFCTLFVLSGVICKFFDMEAVHSALLLLSTTLLAKAAMNPGFILHQKELNYAALFKLELIAKIVSVSAVIIVALRFKSFWAIVIGDLVSSFVLLIGSYTMHRYRPKFSLKNISNQWDFSKWLFFKGMIGYSKSNLDQVFVTKMFDSATIGGFYLARDIAMMPAYDLLNKALVPLLPALAQSQKNHELFNYKISFSIFFVNILAFPIAAVMLVAADSIILTLLGEQWVHVADIFKTFVPLMYFACLAPIFAHALVSRQKVKITFWVDVVALFLHLVPFVILNNIILTDVVMIRSVSLFFSLLILVSSLYFVSRFLPFRALGLSFFPFVSSCLALWIVNNYINGSPSLYTLVIKTSLIAVLYGATTLMIAYIYREVREVKDLQRLFQPLAFRLANLFHSKGRDT